MERDKQVGIFIAGYLLVITLGVVLYYRRSHKGRRMWIAFSPTQQLLGVVYLIGFFLWFGSALAVRPWAAAIGLEGHWTLGVAPSFFAGVTVTAFVAFRCRLRPTLAFVSGTVLMLLLEIVQVWLPNYVFDPFDVLAGLFGAAQVSALLLIYSVKSGASSGNI
jgi:hypothetical protein